MSNILVLYSTVDGHTLKICQYMQRIIEADGHSLQLASIDDCDGVNLESCDKLVIGASIRYGHHRPAVYRFIENHLELLNSRPNAFFSVNVVARKPAKSRPETNPYVRKFLRQIAWQPRHAAVFAGKIEYRRYDFWDRNIIRLIMWITRGPTDPDTSVEFTDWKQVEDFARLISAM